MSAAPIRILMVDEPPIGKLRRALEPWRS